MRWGARSSVSNLDNHIRRSTRRGDLEELEEIRRELQILLKHVDDGFEEAVMRQGKRNGDR